MYEVDAYFNRLPPGTTFKDYVARPELRSKPRKKWLFQLLGSTGKPSGTST